MACRLAGYHGDEIDLADAQDLAAELVRRERLTPFVQWAGGDVMEAAMGAADREATEAMF